MHHQKIAELNSRALEWESPAETRKESDNSQDPFPGFSSILHYDTKALAQQMNLTCAPAPPEIDEFDVAGLTRAPGRLVAAPRVLESPVNFECRLSQLIQLQGADGVQVNSWLVLGEVVAVHIDRALLKDGVYDTAAARPILRAGRLGDYFEIRPDAMFHMRRPGWPIDQ